jgi:hypothetical protein
MTFPAEVFSTLKMRSWPPQSAYSVFPMSLLVLPSPVPPTCARFLAFRLASLPGSAAATIGEPFPQPPEGCLPVGSWSPSRGALSQAEEEVAEHEPLTARAYLP